MNGSLGEQAVAVSLAGLAGEVRGQIETARELGFRAVQLDGTAKGMRARELDRSARRDLAATLKRSGLALSGIDLWIPAAHFGDAAFQDRAVSAVEQAIELATELAGLMADDAARRVSLELPKAAPATLLRQIGAWCERSGVLVADHAFPPSEGREGMIGVGFDPAAVILAGKDAVEELIRLGRRPASARLTDLGAVGRVIPGGAGGRLDVRAYLGALSAVGYAAAVIADVRGFADSERALRETAKRFVTQAAGE